MKIETTHDREGPSTMGLGYSVRIEKGYRTGRITYAMERIEAVVSSARTGGNKKLTRYYGESFNSVVERYIAKGWRIIQP